jgi:hypothetical protein
MSSIECTEPRKMPGRENSIDTTDKTVYYRWNNSLGRYFVEGHGRYMVGSADGWMKGWMKGWMDGCICRMNGWMDGKIDL